MPDTEESLGGSEGKKFDAIIARFTQTGQFGLDPVLLAVQDADADLLGDIADRDIGGHGNADGSNARGDQRLPILQLGQVERAGYAEPNGDQGGQQQGGHRRQTGQVRGLCHADIWGCSGSLVEGLAPPSALGPLDLDPCATIEQSYPTSVEKLVACEMGRVSARN